MRSRGCALAALFVWGAAFAGPTYLARVELGAGQPLSAVAPLAPIVADLGELCLASASDVELAALDAAGYRVAVLDRAGETNHFLVRPRAAFDPGLLTPHCRVLARSSRGFVVAATDEEIPDIIRLPVELVHISRQPMVLTGESRTPELPPVDDSLVWLLVNRVNQDTVLATIRRLQDFYTRYSTTDSLRRACDWMRSRLADFGCDSTCLDSWGTGYAPNVVGVKQGRIRPDLVYVIGGHLDDYAYPGWPDHCPGSDDNASGTAAVIETARAFAGMDFDNTVFFVGFTGEEQGHFGSEAFAQRCRREGDSVCGMMNFDMISYGRQGRDSLDVIGRPSNPNCSWLMDFYIAQADTFSTLATIRRMDSSDVSDHTSFWHQGYVAICAIEDDFTPEFHGPGDTLGPLYYVRCGTNNWPLATEATKAAVASLAKLAGVRAGGGVKENNKLQAPGSKLSILPSVGPAPVYIHLSSAAPVSVFDAAGRLVRSLPTNPPAWDGRDVSGAPAGPGVYYFRAEESSARFVLVE